MAKRSLIIIDSAIEKVVEFAKAYNTLRDDKMYEEMMHLGQLLNKAKSAIIEEEKE